MFISLEIAFDILHKRILLSHRVHTLALPLTSLGDDVAGSAREQSPRRLGDCFGSTLATLAPDASAGVTHAHRLHMSQRALCADALMGMKFLQKHLFVKNVVNLF